MKACISAQVLSVYRLVRLRILSSVMRGLVCVRGCMFLMSLMIFFCILMRGWMYVLFLFGVPQIEMFVMRCGYMWV